MHHDPCPLTLDDDTLATVDAALDALETAFIGLIALTPEQRRGVTRMGEKSVAFCRQTLQALAQNPQILPLSYDLPEAQADLTALDRLRARLMRLQRLTERADDSDSALGSDVMTAALEGYAMLKLCGRDEGIGDLRTELSLRSRSRRKDSPPPADAIPDSETATA